MCRLKSLVTPGVVVGYHGPMVIIVIMHCYSINLLVSASGWHPRVTATVSLLTYDFPYLYLCNHG